MRAFGNTFLYIFFVCWQFKMIVINRIVSNWIRFHHVKFDCDFICSFALDKNRFLNQMQKGLSFVVLCIVWNVFTLKVFEITEKHKSNGNATKNRYSHWNDHDFFLWFVFVRNCTWWNRVYQRFDIEQKSKHDCFVVKRFFCRFLFIHIFFCLCPRSSLLNASFLLLEVHLVIYCDHMWN